MYTQAVVKSLASVLILLLGAIASTELRSCNSCGTECMNACGTRNFKTCCFNYMRKRSVLSDPLPLAMDPGLRLELWLAKSRLPFYQKYYDNISDLSKEQSKI